MKTHVENNMSGAMPSRVGGVAFRRKLGPFGGRLGLLCLVALLPSIAASHSRAIKPQPNGTRLRLEAAFEWTPIAPMRQSRTRHVSVALQDGRVLVVGGTIVEGNLEITDSGATEIFDPALGWSQGPEMPLLDNDSPQNAIGLVLANGNVVIQGGNEDRHQGTGSLVHVLNVQSMSWKNYLIERTGSGSSMINKSAMVAIGPGLMLIGGVKALIPDGNEGYPVSDVCTITDFERPCQHGAPLLEARGDAIAMRVGVHDVMVFGGNSTTPNGWTDELYFLKSVENINLASGEVTLLNPMTTTRSQHKGISLGDGRLLIVGGDFDISRTYPATADIYDPSSRNWLFEKLMAHHSPLDVDATKDGNAVVISDDISHCCEIFESASNRWFEIDKPTGMNRVGGIVRMQNGDLLVTGAGEVNAAILSKWSFPSPAPTATVVPSPTPTIHHARKLLWLPRIARGR